MKKNYSFLLFVFLLLANLTSFSATYYARISGNWSTASTWSTISCAGVSSGTIPGLTDKVIICSGKTVTMNGNSGNCLSLTINGTINWTNTFATNVGAGGLLIDNGGVISGSAIGILNIAGVCTIPDNPSLL